MKSRLKKLFKFLPIVIVLFVLLIPKDASAHGSIHDGLDTLVSWAKDAYDATTEFGKKAIEMASKCVGDLGACADKIKEKMTELGMKALDLLFPDNCSLKTTHTSCVFCSMFKTLFNASAGVAAVSYGAFSGSLGELVIIFLAVSIALIILKNLASFSSKDAGALLNDLFTRAFVCVTIYLIISHDYMRVFNMTIGAAISDGLSLVSGPGGASTTGGLGGAAAGAGANGGQVMPNSVGTQIDHAIRNIEAKIYQLFNYGDYAFCLGTGPKRLWKVVWHPVYLIDGILLYIGGIFFMVGYPWVMADAVLQLGIALALLPFAVAGYAFSLTKRYLPKTFSWIMHSLFVFIFMSILIDCVLTYIGKVLSSAFSAAGDSLFIDAVNGLAFYGSNMVKVIFILAIGWIYMPEIKELAKGFAAGSGLSAGSKVGQTIRDKMEQGVEKSAKYAGKQAWEGTKTTARNLNRTRHALERRGAMTLAKTFGHSDDDGNQVFTVGGRLARNSRVARFFTRGLEFKVSHNTAGDITDERGNKLAKTGEDLRLALDASGNVIGTVTENGFVVKADGTRMGQINANGEILDNSGNVIAKAGEKMRMVYDSAGNAVGFVDTRSDRDSKVVRDLHGNVLGNLDEKGRVVNSGGTVVGSVFKTGEAAMDKNGNIIGHIDGNGNVLDEHGNIIGKADTAGNISITEVTDASQIEKEVIDASGNVIGYVDGGGLVRDVNGNVIAHADGSGRLLNANGAVVGRAGDKVVRNADGSIKYKIDANGNVEDEHGNIVGYVDQSTGNVIVNDKEIGKSVKNVKFAYDSNGHTIGYIQNDGTVKDFHGNILGGVHKTSGSSDVLKREYNSIVGRRHVMYSDKYSTIKEVYTSSGKLIKRDGKFKYNFLKKYLINERGEINQGALQKLLDSPIGRDPNLRKVLLQQVAKELAKKQGHSISKYFHRGQSVLDYQESQTIGTIRGSDAYDDRGNLLGTVKNGRVFDANNRVVGSVDANGNVVSDAKIMIKQVNHSGETLTYGLRIDSLTGQVCTQFARDTRKADPMHKLERKAKLGLHKGVMKGLGLGHYTNSGTQAFDTWLGTHYEIGSDAQGDYYIRDRKKYFFFGPRVTKKFYVDETHRMVDKNGYKGIRKTIAPFVPAGVGAGAAVATALLVPAGAPLLLPIAFGVGGGLWSTILKTRPDSKAEIMAKLGGRTQAKDWRYNYKARFDVNTGQTVYSRSLRKFWNPKNYVRMPLRTTTALVKTGGKAIIKTTTNTLVMAAPVAALGAATLITPWAVPAALGVGLVLNPKKVLTGKIFTDFVKKRTDNFKKDWKEMKQDFNHAADGLQTGNIEEYSDNGKKVIDSSTGKTIKTDFEQSFSTERVDGSKTVNDMNSNDTFSSDNGRQTKREAQFNNGMVEIKVKATVSPDGTVQYETTKVVYSAAAQKDHDSFLDQGGDKYQIVSSSGSVATDLRPENTDSFYLTFGMDNLWGATDIGSMSSENFIVSQILATVRHRKTNKLHTDFTKDIF